MFITDNFLSVSVEEIFNLLLQGKPVFREKKTWLFNSYLIRQHFKVPLLIGHSTSNYRMSIEIICSRNKNFISIYTIQATGNCDLKVSRSQAKIDESLANYFLKTKANNKCFSMLKCICKGLQKSITELER